MSLKHGFLVVLLVGSVSVGWGGSKERPDLNGNWRLEPSLSEIHSRQPGQLTWQIEQTDNSIRLIQRTEDKKNSDGFRCATDGQNCKVKNDGHSAVVSFYYNDGVLIELETEGQDTVTKRRLHVSEDKNTLTVDVIHVLPSGKQPEKLVLSRQPAVASR